jgi:hypothetical protein
MDRKDTIAIPPGAPYLGPMPLRRRSWLVALVAGWPLSGAAQTPDSTPTAWAPPPQYPWIAVAEVAAINLLVNRFDAWVLQADWASGAGSYSWATNLRLGWEWDEDAFTTNMFGHPYHGGLYFNAGRSNGLDYWESAPLSFLGSWTWEYFGESYRPSLNDFFMTSFGGIALGEMLHRLAFTARDNRATGGGRLMKELISVPLDPVGAFNRLLRGEWKEVGPNPPEHDPQAYVLRVNAGAQLLADSSNSDTVRASPSLLADLRYGDPFLTPYRTPFDVFAARLHVSGGGISQLRASGRLYGKDLNRPSPGTRHSFAVNQRYDFVKNPAHVFGGQSVEAGIYSRWRLPAQFALRTHAFADAIILAALDAPSTGVGERLYDFGPGAGFRLEFSLERRGIIYATLYGRTEYVHTVSGASADHVANFSGLEITVPIAWGLGAGLHSEYYLRESRYSDRPAERRDFPEARIFVSWTTARLPENR